MDILAALLSYSPGDFPWEDVTVFAGIAYDYSHIAESTGLSGAHLLVSIIIVAVIAAIRMDWRG